MTALEITGAITALANLIAKDRAAEEIAFIASLLVQLGDTLATIAAAEAFCALCKQQLAKTGKAAQNRAALFI